MKLKRTSLFTRLVILATFMVLLISGCNNPFFLYEEFNPRTSEDVDFFSDGLMRASFGESARVAANNYAHVNRDAGTANITSFLAGDFNAGKVANSVDGIMYLFREVPADKNFKLSATIEVVRFGGLAAGQLSSNGQEGFGIMARDFVPYYPGYSKEDLLTVADDPEGAPFTGNEYFISSSSHSGRANMIFAGGVKRGVRYGYRYGVTGDGDVVTNPDLMSDGSNAGFIYKPDELDSYVDWPTLADRPDFPLIGGVYQLTLEKNNSGFYVSMVPPSDKGAPWEDFIYEPDLLTSINKDSFYVGFFAARSAEINVSNVNYSESSAEQDALKILPQPEIITPDVTVLSPLTNSHPLGKFYRVIAMANVPGYMSVRQNGVQIKNPDGEDWFRSNWVDGDSNFGNVLRPAYFDIPTYDLLLGENTFQLMFYPDDTYPNGDVVVGSTEPIKRVMMVERKLYGTASEPLYVAPNGRSTNTGSIASPLDIKTAINFVQPGQTIIMKSGTYEVQEFHIPRFNSGRADQVKRIEAEVRDTVFIDFVKNPYSRGAVIAGSYWEIDGLHFRNTPNKVKGLEVMGSNNRLEWVKTYNNGDTGFQISGRSNLPTFMWPQNNVVRFAESYNNRDDAEIDADGFGAKLTVGDGNRFEWSISHNNADDGWDLYSKVETGNIGIVVIENSISYRNGVLMDGRISAGGKNGFKLGGEGMPIPHIVRNSIAFQNGANGVTGNSNPDIVLDRVTSFDNGSSNHRNFTIYDSADNISTKATLTGILSLYSPEKAVGKSQDRINITVPSNGYGWSIVGGVGASRNANNQILNTTHVESITPPLWNLNDWGRNNEASAVTDGEGFIRRNTDGTFDLDGFLELIPNISVGASF